ncbi:hypothetical protein [Alicyclobacillus ferrooxydans]|uniref:Uncharacterized protein n=1 Tax=Alicyclobacillus ferrooxydans TaxID=471514 RepID=A0A0P9CSZ9_9BACL|nr:hypothetical protein [Alicyclobacillus ferrooxydans]KPV42767.1 hypothetical protein AN477_15570 [Alicyclobacillus ferrooxydans]
MRKRPTKKVAKKRQAKVAPNSPAQSIQSPMPTAQTASSQKPIDNLKQNLSGKRKAIFQILDDVKKVQPDQWKDPNEVEKLAKNFAGKLGLPVPEERIKQFVNAYKDATKNGPNANVDDIVKKYGKNVDGDTLKEIKKFVPKSK